MFITKIKRVFRAGLTNFWRNGFVSLSSLVVMFITLFMISSLIFMSAILQFSLKEIKDKVDINVYFTSRASEADIFSLKKSIETISEVDNVTYVSKEEALANFKERHQDDALTLEALDELGENPLTASLSIKAKEPSQYESIAKFLGGADGSASTNPIIEKVNYYQNKVVIDKLTKITSAANTVGFWVAILFLIISIVITFNTIRLAIFISKDEISVMRLVGASGRYVKGPFVVSGILYGIVSAILVIVVFFGLTFWVGNLSKNFFIGLDLFDFYLKNFGQIFLIVFGSGIALGAISSYLAVHRYLKI
ncbi:MAG: permease-like cell division protein FtsX [Candidatus Paceibacterota bacterium]